MNSEELIQLLKSDPKKFTYADIEQMMTEEMSKDPSEMDTDFIDLCAKVLCKALDEYNEKKAINKFENEKRIKVRISRIVAVAVALAVILCSAVTVSAKYVYNDTSDKIVKFYEDHFSINLRNNDVDSDEHSNETVDLITELKNSGFDNVILPTVLLTDEYTCDVNITEDEEFLTASVTLKSKIENTTFIANITKYKNGIDFIFDNDMEMTADYNSAKQLSINGVDIFIFGNKETSSIIYVKDNTDYSISLGNCNFDSAIEIAASIK